METELILFGWEAILSEESHSISFCNVYSLIYKTGLTNTYNAVQLTTHIIS